VIVCRSRKVRAPLGTLPGNSWAPAARADGDGQCDRKQTADDCDLDRKEAIQSGKGEKVE
jgi:hypothetical protein